MTTARPDHTVPIGPAERFAALVEAFADEPGVTGPHEGRRGFGASALQVEGSIFAMLTRGRLVVKLPAPRVTALIDDGIGDHFDAGKGRPMKQWVTVVVDDDDTWADLATEALQFVRSLPRQSG